jgi:hypothetical protein
MFIFKSMLFTSFFSIFVNEIFYRFEIDSKHVENPDLHTDLKNLDEKNPQAKV